MDKLPPEIILNILNYLDFKDLLRTSLVSKNWLDITNSHLISRKILLNFSKDLLKEKSLGKFRNYLCVKIEVTKGFFKHEVPRAITEHLFQLVGYLELVFPEDDFFCHSKYVKNFFKLLIEMRNLKSLKWESIEEISGPVLEEYVHWQFGCKYQELAFYQMDYSNFNDFFRLFQKSIHLKQLIIDCDVHLDQVLWNDSLLNFLASQKNLKKLHLRWLELDNNFFMLFVEKSSNNVQLTNFTLEYGCLPQHENFCRFLKNQNLHYLKLSETKGLNDVILNQICGLKNLNNLEIDICNGFEITSSEIPEFCNLKKLKQQKISNHPLLEKSCCQFFNKITRPGNINRNLRELKLQYITLANFQEMTNNFPNLLVLELKECNLTNFDLKIIFSELRYLYKLNLDISNSKITNDCRIETTLEDLKHLTLLNGHHLIREDFIESILQKTPNLRNLHYEFCINLGNVWIKIALNHLKFLKVLKLSGFGGIQHPKLNIELFQIIQGSNNLELKLNFFLYTKFVENFNMLENLKIVCE